MTSAMMAVKQVMMVTMCHYPYRTLPVRLPKVPMSKENCIIPSEYWSVGFLWQALGCITRGGHAHTAYTALGNIYPVYSAYILLQAVYIQAIYTQYILRIYCSRQYISNISWVYILRKIIVFSAFSCSFVTCSLQFQTHFWQAPHHLPPDSDSSAQDKKKNRKEQNYYRHTW